MPEKKNGKAATSGGISKMEAVRQAVTKLGQSATRSEIQRFVKEQLNIDMSPDVISTYKADLARKARKRRKAAKPAAAKAAARAKAAPKPAPRTNGKSGIGLADLQTVKTLVHRIGAADLKSLIDVLAK